MPDKLYKYPALQKALVPDGDMIAQSQAAKDLEKFVLDVIREHIADIEATAKLIREQKR